ncbi:metalloendopeptidase [Coemansia sp. RSA 1821]|nr:metalloendopeptidase [Coemansia sp. RSA 1086]KAJ1751094.1 metalloendopeptidase [Coemansia sp. RSA 1821]
MPSSDFDSAAVRFDATADEILGQTMSMLSKERLLLDEVAATKEPTFESVIKPIGEMYNSHESAYKLNKFLHKVSSNKGVCDAAAESEALEKDFKAECLMREDIYQLIRAVYDNQEEMEKLEAEDKRLVAKMEMKYRREGAALSEEKRKELVKLKVQLAKLELAFQRNITEQEGKAWFTRGELAGLPESYFYKRQSKQVGGDEKFMVTTGYNDYLQLMKYAKLEATRRAMFLIQNTRCADNLKLLEEAIKLRLEKAQLLGYSTHAEYALEPLMAQTPQNAYNMLSELRKQFTELGTKELEELEALKQADIESEGRVYEGFYEWDRSFYAQMLLQKRHPINYEQVKGYFSLLHVVSGILETFQEMFQLKLTEQENAKAWHSDVVMYKVEDASGKPLGHFYLDLFTRPNKYSHISAFSLQAGCKLNDQLPVAALVCNFNKPTASTPVFLFQHEVESLMKEIGKVFQNLLSQPKWAQFHGFDALEPDCANAHGQMFEASLMNPNILRKITFHYKTNESIPEELALKLIAAKNEGTGLVHLRQVFLAMYDLAINNSEDTVDANEMFNSMNSDISLISCGSTKTLVVTKFPQYMADELAGTYYAYLWSQACGADMYQEVFLNNNGDAEAWQKYRTGVVEVGATQSSSAVISEYLGRDPSANAFVRLFS